MNSKTRWAVLFSALVLVALVCATALGSEPVRIGIITDVHAHDTESPVEHKVMSNYAERLDVFVDAMNAWPADAVIELGDLVNGAFVLGAEHGDPARIPQILDQAVAALAPLEPPLYYVLGNHDLYDLSKAQFLEGVGRERTYGSFDLGGFHVVLLDAEYNDPDGSDYDHVFMRVKCRIPQEEIDWLREDLAATQRPTIVCLHQPLDSTFDPNAGGPPVVNHEQVQAILHGSGVVIAVFQGHDHDNHHQEIDGIHYLTFAAMVDHTDPTAPTWGQVTLDAEARTISVEGFGEQSDWKLGF